ncbi:hypothetical protein CL689_04820 [Candidatus Saccharibacteria bacterium]|nr:hypothetical protein [Candidatus Saccharibacteria bacterium]
MASNDIFDFGSSAEKKAEDATPSPQPFSLMNEVEGLAAQEASSTEEAPASQTSSSAEEDHEQPVDQKKKGISLLLQNKMALASLAFFGLIVAFVIFRMFVYQAPQPADQDVLGQSQAPTPSSGDVFQGDNSLPPGLAGEPVAIPPEVTGPTEGAAPSQYGAEASAGIRQDMSVFGTDPNSNNAPTPAPEVYGATSPQPQQPSVVEGVVVQTTPQPEPPAAQPTIQPEPQMASAMSVEAQDEIASLKKQIADRDVKIKSLQSQLNVSKREYAKLAGVSKKLLAKEKEMVAFAKGESPSSSKAAPEKASSVSSMYSIKAIVEGLAWLNTTDGRVITVRAGDSLAKNVSVTSIDPVKMIVRTSAGEIN